MIHSLNKALLWRSIFPFYYWSNEEGEVLHPEAKEGEIRSVEELPMHVRLAFQHFRPRTEYGVGMVVLSVNDDAGIGLNWAFEMDAELRMRSREVLDAVRIVASRLEISFPYAEIYIGEETDPMGHELLMFIPYKHIKRFRNDATNFKIGNGKKIGSYVYDQFQNLVDSLTQPQVSADATEPKLDRYIGLIRGEFVRDAQFFNGESFSDSIDIFDEEHEACWTDVQGSILVFDGPAASEAEVLSRLASLYSCSENQLLVLRVNESESGAKKTQPHGKSGMWHYETGRETLEILGSGSQYSNLFYTSSEVEAIAAFMDPNGPYRNYLMRRRYVQGHEETQYWEDGQWINK